MASQIENNNQERSNSIEKARVEAAVFATNALISEKELQDLKNAIGGEVVIRTNYNERRMSEDVMKKEVRSEKTALRNFGYIVKNKTGETYVTYFEGEDGTIYLPHVASMDPLEEEDYETKSIEKVNTADGRTICTFDSLKERILTDDRTLSNITLKSIIANSKSVLEQDSEKYQEQLYFVELFKGTDDNFVKRFRVTGESLELLKKEIGKQVKVNVRKENWETVRPYLDRDYSQSDRYVRGELSEVDEYGIVINVAKNTDNTESTSSEPMAIPFKYHEHNKKQSSAITEILGIKTLNTNFSLKRKP